MSKKCQPYAQTVNGKKGVHLMMPKSVMDGMAAAGGAGAGGWKSTVGGAAQKLFLFRLTRIRLKARMVW